MTYEEGFFFSRRRVSLIATPLDKLKIIDVGQRDDEMV